MLKKALLVLIPFILIFLLGVGLLLRPQYPARVVEVVDTYARREKTSPRSMHRHTVYYAVVTVEFDGALYSVDVRDNVWLPVAPGDSVTVTWGLWGNLVEYRTTNAYRLMMFSAFMTPVMLILFICISRRRDRQSETHD